MVRFLKLFWEMISWQNTHSLNISLPLSLTQYICICIEHKVWKILLYFKHTHLVVDSASTKVYLHFRTEYKKGIFFLLRKVFDQGEGSRKNLARGLKDKSKNPFFESNEHGESLLTVTARKGNLEILKFLLEHGGDLSVHDTTRMYPIHTASLYGHNSLIGHMLNNNVSINLSGPKGNTPLHYATMNSKPATVEYLIRMRANINAQNHEGQMPHHIAKMCQNKAVKQLLEDAMREKVSKAQPKHPRVALPKEFANKLTKVEDKVERQQEEISSIKEKTNEHEQKITEIETDYKAAQDERFGAIMLKLENIESKYEDTGSLVRQDMNKKPGFMTMPQEMATPTSYARKPLPKYTSKWKTYITVTKFGCFSNINSFISWAQFHKGS